MGSSKEDIQGWIKLGQEQGATHMIVVCDTFDWDDYPVYVKPEENPHSVYDKYNGNNMQKVMEVYNLKEDIEYQLSVPRNFFF